MEESPRKRFKQADLFQGSDAVAATKLEPETVAARIFAPTVSVPLKPAVRCTQ
jgi:hypothetical protein